MGIWRTLFGKKCSQHDIGLAMVHCSNIMANLCAMHCKEAITLLQTSNDDMSIDEDELAVYLIYNYLDLLGKMRIKDDYFLFIILKTMQSLQYPQTGKALFNDYDLEDFGARDYPQPDRIDEYFEVDHNAPNEVESIIKVITRAQKYIFGDDKYINLENARILQSVIREELIVETFRKCPKLYCLQ